MNNKIHNQQQKPAQGASSKANRGKPKGIPRGEWKEIPLNKLRRWEKNVRTTEAGEENGSALEASLQSQGLLQNLVVIEAEDGFHDVAAGGRRIEKLQALAEKKKLAANLYNQRWEIELGYREMKQSLLDSRYTLRSKTPEMIEQELWGVLLGYNLLRYQMLEMSRHCPGIYPCEMSFTACTWAILGLLNGLSLRHPGNIPKYLAELQASALHYVLPHRREDRCYPRVVRPKPSKYPTKHKNASQLI